MKLSQATRFAIWSIVELASRPGEQVSANEIASLYGISQHHLAKVLRTLSRAGLVSSTRGPGGGCEFTASANRLTLYDVINLFEGGWVDEETSNVPPTPVGAEVSRVLGEIDRITLATLRSVTIQTLIKNARRKQERRGDAPRLVQNSRKPELQP